MLLPEARLPPQSEEEKLLEDNGQLVTSTEEQSESSSRDRMEVGVMCSRTMTQKSSMASVRVQGGLTRKSQHIFVSLALPKPDVLRAAHAGAPLSCAGYVFRHKGTEGSFARGARVLTPNGAADPYDLSFKVRRIQDFWSHSWHAPVARKVATLLFTYNGLPAAVSSTVAAFCGAGLSAAGVLPPMVYEQSEDGSRTLGYAVWAQAFGICSFLVVLLLWWSRRTVFLDKVCIHQTDAALKQQGVESIGGFLRHSDFMVVLWDDTYARRLWCIFEVAAFAKTHSSDLSKRLRIVPIDLGLVLLAFFVVACLTSVFYMLTPKRFRLLLGVAFVLVGYSPCAWILRRYSRKLSTLWKDLQGFSVRSANCYCCSVGHADPETKSQLACDRKVVEFCIVQWFGCLDAFDDFVRVDLLNHFRAELGCHGFSYRWAVLAMTPLIWWQCETISAYLRADAEDSGLLVALTLSTLAAWLFNGPLAVAAIMRLVGSMQCLWDHWAVDAAVAFVGALLGGAVSWSVARLELLAWEASPVLFAAVLVTEATVTLAVYCRAVSSFLRAAGPSRDKPLAPSGGGLAPGHRPPG